MTRWIQQQLARTGPLVVRSEGFAAGHAGRDDAPDRGGASSIHVPSTPEVVWTSDDGQVLVFAVAVHHEPVPEAVAYRIETPDAIIVISGDTRVCSEIEGLSAGADVLVHEACRTSAMRPLIAGTVFEAIFSYHADTVELGKMASRAGIPHVVLTHLIPPPETGDAETFAHDLRNGGYQGRITVGEDLTVISL